MYKMSDDRLILDPDLAEPIESEQENDFKGKLYHPHSNLDLGVVSIVYISGKYFLQNDRGYTWRVLKSQKRFGRQAKPHKLARGDILKLGRYIFEVKDISSMNQNPDRQQR